MVESQIHHLDSIFHALGDQTRRSMLLELAQGERSVGQLAQPFDMSLAAASKHIKVLESAGLIRREVQWRNHICRLEPGPLASAFEWLRFYEIFWNSKLDVLEQLLHSAAQASSEDKPVLAVKIKTTRLKPQGKKP